ncbi:MAG: hypothetical protein J7L55_05805 [Desulfurococcales archaeon]|nr:hypothetical protein [Desulfurococcales archaeon]
MMRSDLRNASVKRRAAYVALYLALTAYPLYRVFEGAALLPDIFKLIPAAAAALIPLGMYYGRSEFIVTYYVVVTAVLQANRIPYPSPAETLIYSLLMLHADILGKALTVGGYGRRVSVGLKGAAATSVVVAALALTYISTGYWSAYLAVGLKDAAVAANGLTEVVLGAFLSTRAGSVMLVVFLSIFTAYVVSRYLGETLSEVLAMSRGYALAAGNAHMKAELQALIEGRAWYLRLMKYSSLTFVALVAWFIVAPAVRPAVSAAPLITYLREDLRSGISGLISLGLGILITYLLYRGVRGGAEALIMPGDMRMRRFRRYSVMYIAIPAALLTFYVILLYGVSGLQGFEHVLMRSLGLGGEPPTIHEVRTPWIWGLPGTITSYFSDAVSTFKELTYLLRALITILWG